MIASGVLVGLTENWMLMLFFLAGWLFSTLLFSPDTDFAPKKRTGLLQFVLYPYSILFKHRGISHSILLGTLTRMIYGIILLGFMIFVFHKMGYISFNVKTYGGHLLFFIKNFNFKDRIYQVIVSFFAGMFLSDLFHILLDKWSTFLKKIMRGIF